MNLHVSDFLENRIEEITKDLQRTNSEYALAVEKSKNLFDNIDPIIKHEREITISADDCTDFRKFLDYEFMRAAIIQKELYKQGYLDCVKLLGMLGVLR